MHLGKVYRNKTAALFESALSMGAISADAPPNTCRLLKHCGLELGLAFQIQDDLDDYEDEPEKITWPKLHGFDQARETVETLHRDLNRKLATLALPSPSWTKSIIDSARRRSTL